MIPLNRQHCVDWLRNAALDALAVVFPVDCAGCGSPDRSLCASCVRGLAPVPGVHLLAGSVPVHTALTYGGEVRRSILALKEKGRTDTARPLAVPLATAILAALRTGTPPDAPTVPGVGRGASGVEILTVPTSRSAWRRRGYDPVALLCRGIRPRPVKRVLVQGGSHRRQKSLGIEERARNLAGTMRVRGSLAGRRFVIVDDVLTTGATMSEAIRAVREAGGEVVSGAALAFTPRRWEVPQSLRKLK